MSLVEKIDNVLIDGASKLVKGYNYVTGGTREDLRRTVYHAGFLMHPLVEIMNHQERFNTGVAAAFCVTGMVINELVHPYRKRAEEREYAARESRVKTVDREAEVGRAKHCAKLDLSLSMMLYYVGGNGTFIGTLGINNYIKCVEPQTPQKNVLTRKIEEYEANKAMQPAHVLASKLDEQL